MKLFPQNVTASLSVQPIAALQPILKKLGLLSATPRKPRRKALLIGINRDFPAATVPEDKWIDFEEESYNQAAGSFKTRGSTILPLKEPGKNVNQLKQLLISMSHTHFISVIVEPSAWLDNYDVEEEDITLLVDDRDNGHVQPTKVNIVSLSKFEQPMSSACLQSFFVLL